MKKPIRGLPTVVLSIGDHIKKKRLELGLLQRQVAKLLHTSEDTITYWENGRAVPMIHHYPTIIAFLGYNPFLISTESFARRITAYRKLNGLSLKKFGNQLGVDASTVSSWEAEASTPYSEMQRKIAALISSR